MGEEERENGKHPLECISIEEAGRLRFLTGASTLDHALGGGIPPGIVEVSGPESSGKTTLAMSIMREADLRRFQTAYISCSKPNPEYMRKAGPRECLCVSPGSAESAFDAAFKLVDAGVRVIVIDTITAMLPHVDRHRPLNEGETPFAMRRLAFHALSHLEPKLSESGSLLVVLSEVRQKIGRGYPSSPMDGTIDSICGIRMSTSKIKTRTEFGDFSYLKFGMRIKQSKFCPPGQTAEAFIWKDGINRSFELMRLLLATNILEVRGSRIMGPDGISLGPGLLKAAQQIEESFQRFFSMTHLGR